MSQKNRTEDAEKPEAMGAWRDYTSFLNPPNLLLILTVVAALFFLVLYSRANSSLTRENEELRDRVAAYATYMNAQVGDGVPPIQSTDLRGNPIRVEYHAPVKYLIFVFTTRCSACLDELPTWDTLAEKATSKDYVTLGISVDSLEDTKTNLEGKYKHLNVITAPDQNFLRTYRVNAFPQTMIISDNGLVEWVHVGKLSQEQYQELTKKITPHKP